MTSALKHTVRLADWPAAHQPADKTQGCGLWAMPYACGLLHILIAFDSGTALGPECAQAHKFLYMSQTELVKQKQNAMDNALRSGEALMHGPEGPVLRS